MRLRKRFIVSMRRKMKKYMLTTTTYHTETALTFYGIALVEQDNNSYELIKAFNDLTRDRVAIENLIDD